MLERHKIGEVWVRNEPVAFDLWLRAELRQMYGEPEVPPEELLHLVDRVCAQD